MVVTSVQNWFQVLCNPLNDTENQECPVMVKIQNPCSSEPGDHNCFEEKWIHPKCKETDESKVETVTMFHYL